jgi:hypothetical protein
MEVHVIQSAVLRRQLEEETVVRELPAVKDVNTEGEEANETTALEAVTRQQPVKIQQAEI